MSSVTALVFHHGFPSGLMMTMSMLKQTSSKSWLSSKLWLLEFEIVIKGKGCEKLEYKLHGNMGDHGCRF